MRLPVSYLKADLSRRGIAHHPFPMSCCRDRYPHLVCTFPQRADLGLQPHTSAPVPSGSSRFVAGPTLRLTVTARSYKSTVGSGSQRKWELFVFEDANNEFHFPSLPPEDSTMHHSILELIPPNFLSNPEVKHVLVPSKPITSEDARRNTPQFSPSAFFRAIDEFRLGTEDTRQGTNPGSYGKIFSSTQRMSDNMNPSFLRALPSPIVSLATAQLAGRGGGSNTWLSSQLQDACRCRPRFVLGSEGLLQIWI
ncbi:hypothetical protein BDR03DRAFT_458732 [Suillus americanus]|nr:hypothetical protein BDR03DRAFT_458732 [Suillus americanus]